jgi:hypothetical protein
MVLPFFEFSLFYPAAAVHKETRSTQTKLLDEGVIQYQSPMALDRAVMHLGLGS